MLRFIVYPTSSLMFIVLTINLFLLLLSIFKRPVVFRYESLFRYRNFGIESFHLVSLQLLDAKVVIFDVFLILFCFSFVFSLSLFPISGSSNLSIFFCNLKKRFLITKITNTSVIFFSF